jgi:hypothetical protein
MACLKNKQKFFWWEFNGAHDYRPVSVAVFMWGGDTFVVNFECALCGCKMVHHIVKWDELLELGLTNAEIEKVQHSHWTESPESWKK